MNQKLAVTYWADSFMSSPILIRCSMSLWPLSCEGVAAFGKSNGDQDGCKEKAGKNPETEKDSADTG
jgi:hypothetical protein